MEKQAYIWEIDEENAAERFVQTLAQVLADLHNIPNKQAEKVGIEVLSPKDIRQQMQKRMENVNNKYGAEESLWARWQRWLKDDSLWPEQTALIHGDLHPGHIIVNDRDRVTGLIDWTEAKVTDIAKDFIGYLMVFGEEELDRLIQAYKDAGGYHWPKMKEHIIELSTTSAIDIAEFAEKSGLEEYEQMAKQALGVLDTEE